MKIFLDMDGVLCDFYGGIWKLFPISTLYQPAWPYKPTPNKWAFFEDPPLLTTTSNVSRYMDHKFYENLDWLDDGKEILEHCERIAGRNNVVLLTSPWDTPGCREGKFAWVANNLPHYKHRMFTGSPKEAISAPDFVLVDDSDENCQKWVDAPDGGDAILVPRPWNSQHHRCDFANGRIKDLKEFFNHDTRGDATRECQSHASSKATAPNGE